MQRARRARMIRPIVALVVLFGAPSSIAHAQDAGELDPATIAVLDDPPRMLLRISVVEADLRSTERRLTLLPDRTPWHVGIGLGIALAAAGLVTELVALLGLLGAELGSGVACGIDRLRMEPCTDPPTPSWIGMTAIAGAPGIFVGIMTVLVAASQLHSIAGRREGLVRRRDGRLRELDLLRSFELQATGDSIGIGAAGTF